MRVANPRQGDFAEPDQGLAARVRRPPGRISATTSETLPLHYRSTAARFFVRELRLPQFRAVLAIDFALLRRGRPRAAQRASPVKAEIATRPGKRWLARRNAAGSAKDAVRQATR